MGRRLKTTTKEDFIRRLSQASPLDCLEELIWNALDEDAPSVEVIVTANSLGGVDKIRINDNGKSLRFADAPDAFSNLGDSKKPSRQLDAGGKLHGRLGQGRHKAFGLGKRAVWKFVYPKDRMLYEYEIEGTAGRDNPFYLSDERIAEDESKSDC